MSSSNTLAGQRILIFVGDDYEDLELWYPKLRLMEAGATVTVAGLQGKTAYRGKIGYPCVSEVMIESQNSADYQGVICAGGWMPDKLRRDRKVLCLTREIAEAGKLVAAICHGGLIPISANVYRGVKVTGSPGIKDDLINAGGIFEASAVVIDRNFVSSRKPGDLPAFCQGILQVLTHHAEASKK